jgi:DNA-binding transcriptional ArsR family regulator
VRDPKARGGAAFAGTTRPAGGRPRRTHRGDNTTGGLSHRELDICLYRNIVLLVARSPTTSDVFNAIGDAHRREILDQLITGEKAVAAIVSHLAIPQPQVSKHLRVLSEVGLVSCRAEGRRRLYRLEPARLRPLHEWVAKFERAMNARLDRMEVYLKELQQGGRQ